MHYGYSEQGLDCEFICILIHPILFKYNHEFFNHFVNTIISNNQIEYLYICHKKEMKIIYYHYLINYFYYINLQFQKKKFYTCSYFQNLALNFILF